MNAATIIEHDGTRQSVKEWALDYGITTAIIVARLKAGQTPAQAIETPIIALRGQILGKQAAVYPRRKKAPRKVPTYTQDGVTRARLANGPQHSDCRQRPSPIGSSLACRRTASSHRAVANVQS